MKQRLTIQQNVVKSKKKDKKLIFHDETIVYQDISKKNLEKLI